MLLTSKGGVAAELPISNQSSKSARHVISPERLAPDRPEGYIQQMV
jgi:hypothetical protein